MNKTHPETLKKQGAAFWNTNPCSGKWISYREFMAWMHRTEPYIFNILNGYDWAGKRVLEVGCGQGTTFNYLPRFGPNLVGIDMSGQSLLQTRAGAQELAIARQDCLASADAEKLPFRDNCFDAVISIGVLHHTVDTAAGIREIHRVLKPGGQAIVMLYRTDNPKWWVTRTLRGISQTIGTINRHPTSIVENLRSRQPENSNTGTALLELYGVPILKAFSNQQARRFFNGFTEIHISNHQAGFRRLVDIVPQLQLLTTGLGWLDQRTQKFWGFYQVIEARK